LLAGLYFPGSQSVCLSCPPATTITRPREPRHQPNSYQHLLPAVATPRQSSLCYAKVLKDRLIKYRREKLARQLHCYRAGPKRAAKVHASLRQQHSGEPRGACPSEDDFGDIIAAAAVDEKKA